MNNHGLTPEQAKEVLELGLTPWEFENLKGNYITNSRTANEHRQEVIEILKRRKAEGRPITKAHYESVGTTDNLTATFFWVAAMVVGTIFKDRIFVYKL
ncbi:MAG: hypothetical protein IJB48_00385 [Clostridia bacterium]|nr:hypothetical protein [Clostridia bacterium]